MIVEQVVFWIASSIVIISSVVVITSSYPVRSILSLVLAFVATAVLWILQGAEFLGLALIFVYVGAVMTLFLFVVMMLYQKNKLEDKKDIKKLITAFLFAIALISLIAYIGLPHDVLNKSINTIKVSNTKFIGKELYTNYIVEFELAAFILLTGMIAAIAITFRGQRVGNKAVKVEKQIKVTAKDRLHFADFDKG